jgi:hypothetical protein
MRSAAIECRDLIANVSLQLFAESADMVLPLVRKELDMPLTLRLTPLASRLARCASRLSPRAFRLTQ